MTSVGTNTLIFFLLGCPTVIFLFYNLANASPPLIDTLLYFRIQAISGLLLSHSSIQRRVIGGHQRSSSFWQPPSLRSDMYSWRPNSLLEIYWSSDFGWACLHLPSPFATSCKQPKNSNTRSTLVRFFSGICLFTKLNNNFVFSECTIRSSS